MEVLHKGILNSVTDLIQIFCIAHVIMMTNEGAQFAVGHTMYCLVLTHAVIVPNPTLGA
jgi:hypothetical protein